MGLLVMILVFVYLGTTVPKYVTSNMRQVANRFPKYDLVFIGDDSKSCKKVSDLGFKTWQSPDPESAWELNRYSLSHNPNFRDGFWFKTLARFFALNEFLKTSPKNSCLLIESDVWVSPTFPMDKFENADFEIAYPLTTAKQGVASTMFVKSQLEMQHFLGFATAEVRRNPNSSDVTILAEYNKNFPERVLVLPSGPTNKLAYNHGFQDLEPYLMSKQTPFQNQIFDGSTWGQFLTGEDPRNSWGFRLIYHVQQHHAVNPSFFNFKHAQEKLIASNQGVEYVINSLHVHSKDTRVFLNEGFVEDRVSSYKGIENKEIVWKYLIRFIPSRIRIELRHLSMKFVRKFHKK